MPIDWLAEAPDRSLVFNHCVLRKLERGVQAFVRQFLPLSMGLGLMPRLQCNGFRVSALCIDPYNESALE